MLKKYIPSHKVTEVRYEVNFFNHKDGGYGFPCDENGNINKETMCKEAIQNYEYCLAHPEEFHVFNKIEKIESSYREPAHGICKCGEEVVLVDEYMGSCQCENCGQWYNLFGQELLPPSQWEEDW